MKYLPLAIITVIIGFVFAANLGSIFDGGSAEFSYYSAIVFSILYLSGVIVIATGLILDKLNKLIKVKGIEKE